MSVASAWATWNSACRSGGEHRARIDAARLRPQRAAGAAEDRAERALGDGGDLADEVELVVVEPAAHPGVQLGEHVERMGREEARLVAARDLEQRLGLDHGGGGLAHQLVGGDADREGKPEPLAHLALHPRGHIHGGTEQPAGAGEVEKGVAVAARLDDRRVDPEHLVERARGAGVEPGVGREQHEIGAALERLAHRHAPLDTGQPRLGREGEDGGAVGAGRRHRDGPRPERRRDQPFHGGAEGGRVDEEDGAHGGPAYSRTGCSSARGARPSFPSSWCRRFRPSSTRKAVLALELLEPGGERALVRGARALAAARSGARSARRARGTPGRAREGSGAAPRGRAGAPTRPRSGRPPPSPRP